MPKLVTNAPRFSGDRISASGSDQSYHGLNGIELNEEACQYGDFINRVHNLGEDNFHSCGILWHGLKLFAVNDLSTASKQQGVKKSREHFRQNRGMIPQVSYTLAIKGA